jgi:hypothetical protein
MIRSGVGYTGATMLAGAAVAAVGAALLDGAADRAVAVGAVAGVLIQVTIFWALFVFALRSHRALAHGAGALIRLVSLGLFAFLVVPAAGVAPAPALFSLVACLFLSTLLEVPFIRQSAGGTVPPARIGAQST